MLNKRILTIFEVATLWHLGSTGITNVLVMLKKTGTDVISSSHRTLLSYIGRYTHMCIRYVFVESSRPSRLKILDRKKMWNVTGTTF